MTPDASILLPAKGRPAQTAALIPRLAETAGRVRWELIVIVDADPEVTKALQPLRHLCKLISLPERVGYWKALAAGTAHARGRLLGNIANDVLPGLAWLARAVRRYDAAFPAQDGVLGWNDGLIFEGHTGHLLLSRALAERWYGPAGWPVWYDHLRGDVEICRRAIDAERYVVALDAVLYHNHPVVGQELDGVYRFSHTHQGADAALYARREASGWTYQP